MTSTNAKSKAAAVEDTLDSRTNARRAVLAEMRKMTPKQLFEIAVRAGIYTKRGRLTSPYRDDTAPSAARPTD
jgi:hypothetical protein